MTRHREAGDAGESVARLIPSEAYERKEWREASGPRRPRIREPDRKREQPNVFERCDWNGPRVRSSISRYTQQSLKVAEAMAEVLRERGL